MAETIALDKREWEVFLEENDKLIKKCEDLLKTVADQRQESADAVRRAETAERELETLRHQASGIEERYKTDSEKASVAIRNLRSNIDRVMKKMVEAGIEPADA